MQENAFPRAYCYEILRLLSEILLTANYHWGTFFKDFTHWFSSEIKDHKIQKNLI